MKKKAPAKKTAKKATAKKPVPKRAKAKAPARPKPLPKPAGLAIITPAEPHKPGVHLPSKPAPAYSQMIQRGWAGKPPPHKISK